MAGGPKLASKLSEAFKTTPEHLQKECVPLVRECLQHDANDRPRFCHLVPMLEVLSLPAAHLHLGIC